METRTGFLITQIKQVQGRVFQRLLEDCGVEEFNGPQGRILYVLWQEDNVPIAALVRKTGLAKNTLTVMLARMEAAGLVTRRESPQDRRQGQQPEATLAEGHFFTKIWSVVVSSRPGVAMYSPS